MNTRGQTTYDYLIGIVLLLVTVIAVLSVLPQVFDPFVEPVSSEEQGLADRVATETIETNGTGSGDRTLDVSGIQDEQQYISDLKKRSGIWEPDIRSVNITFQRPDGEVVATVGDSRITDNPEARVVRNVRLVNNPTCDSACQMIVRVW